MIVQLITFDFATRVQCFIVRRFEMASRVATKNTVQTGGIALIHHRLLYQHWLIHGFHQQMQGIHVDQPVQKIGCFQIVQLSQLGCR